MKNEKSNRKNNQEEVNIAIKKKEIFEEIEVQINKMDNKAGLLISAVGIVFALSIDLLDIFSKKGFESMAKWRRITAYAFSILYVLSFIFSMLMFISSIFPRKNKKQKESNNEYLHVNYYYDLSELQKAEEKDKRDGIFNEALSEEVKTLDNLTNQIFTNADICRKKHDKLFYGIIALVPFAISMVILLLFRVFVK